jgi:hypothetical protein
MTIAIGIFDGSVRLQGAAGLRNPLLKVLLLCLPMALVMYQFIARAAEWPRLSMEQVLISAVFIYAMSTLNFSYRERPLFFRRLAAAAFGMSLVLWIARHPEHAISKFFGVFYALYSSIPLLNWIQPESWIYFAVLYVMLIAARNVTTRDALWLGRRFLWQRAYTLYMLTIVTFTLISSTFPLRASVSANVASDKAVLLRSSRITRRYSRRQRFETRIWLFAVTMIMQNSEMAQAIEALAIQRGLFRSGYRDDMLWRPSNEDIAALLIILLGLYAVIILKI